MGVFAEDFGGMMEGEHDLGAEAFADMAMGGMDMGLELNALQIRAFLRNESDERKENRQEPSAYEVLRNGAVHYSRREDKMKALQDHPAVANVSPDGRTVGCKCGRNVRLNPPWYILKFEQHVASRNCSFLRSKSTKKRSRAEMQTHSHKSHERSKQQSSETSGQDKGQEGPTDTVAEDADDGEPQGYSLQSVDTLLRREFGVVADGRRTVVPPAANAPDSRVRMYKGAMTLRENPHFSRVTPDGHFVECKCSRIILLSGPWQPGQFLIHVADKQKPKKRASTSVSAAASAQRKKTRTLATGSTLSSAPLASAGAQVRRTTSATALLQAQKNKRSFPREIRWDAARTRGLLPCPGLRDERMNTFVASAVQLTGGARPRQKIARELFPHLFSDSAEYDHDDETDREDAGRPDIDSSSKKRAKSHQQLLEAEKLLLHDVIEGEALWFVDKDGNSVRSLDCLGVIDAAKGEERCSSCTSLRSNAALRAACSTKYKVATRSGPPPNPINKKFCSGSVCSLLEAEFDMREPHSRLLRDLALADISSGSPLNTWMEMAAMGLSGDFDTNPALLGVADTMVRLKDKEQRGVGLQNMTYSEHLDAFMRSLSDVSSEACDLFQRHLGGRKQRQLLAATSRAVLPSKRKLPHPTDTNTGDESSATNQQLQNESSLYEGESRDTGSASRVTTEEGFVHLLDPSSMPQLSIGDIQDVDLGSFPSSNGMQQQVHSESSESTATSTAADDSNDPTQVPTPKERQRGEAANAVTNSAESVTPASGEKDTDGGSSQDNSKEYNESAESFLTDPPAGEGPANESENAPVIPTNHVPCTGLRDENVQAYVANAVQLVGGSRPRYVIARELFPRVFGNDKKVRIVDKLNSEQRLVLQDAVFSECLWRVDKEGRCVRSLRCKRFVPISDKKAPAPPQNQGVCRACRDLRTVPNFRSVLSRSKVPKKLENIKYVPSVYTESDPFLRKLSKNSAFRGLYQIVKRLTSSEASEGDAERRKQVCFWLRFARMGVFGHFHSHPVFEGLIKSMVEIKDKERRGVGKQNMQYSRALDDFMQAVTQISTEAFELFATQFCGRTLRSQKVKRKSAATLQQSAVPQSVAMHEQASLGETQMAADTQNTIDQPLPPPVPLPVSSHQQYLMQTDDILGGRSLSSEESQRFVDRMMIELSATRHMQLEDERRLSTSGDISGSGGQEEHMNEDDTNRLGPETYLNDDGVLTTEI